MNFKKIFILFFIITSCTSTNNLKNQNIVSHVKFSKKGFALVYDFSDEVKQEVAKKIDERSLLIYQKNLKKGTEVKIINLFNNKSIVATVGSDTKYPSFYNSVLSKRIAKEIDLEINQPYVEILTLNTGTFFIAKKAKTFEEERQVANKAPVDGISINDLSEANKKINKKKKIPLDFNYVIKIAEFYFEKSALMLKKRIMDNTNINNVKITKLSKNAYRVYIGPYNNLISLKNAYNDISQLEFENIEIIKL